MTLLDHTVLERARQNVGLLPTGLAQKLHISVDTVTAIIERGVEDHNVTLADLRRMAAVLAIPARELLIGGGLQEPADQPCSQLVAMLHRDGARPISELASRLQRTPDDILDAVDAYNHDTVHGLRIMRWHDHIGLIPDPAIEIPERAAAFDEPAEARTDRLLWQVIDRELPKPLAKATITRLQTMTGQGLVTTFDGQWRPTDDVIATFDLIDWDTLELLQFARGLPEVRHTGA